MDFWNEMGRWYREIHEEEERRAKLTKQVDLAKPVKLTEESEDESESESESEDDSDSD